MLIENIKANGHTDIIFNNINLHGGGKRTASQERKKKKKQRDKKKE